MWDKCRGKHSLAEFNIIIQNVKHAIVKSDEIPIHLKFHSVQVINDDCHFIMMRVLFSLIFFASGEKWKKKLFKIDQTLDWWLKLIAEHFEMVMSIRRNVPFQVLQHLMDFCFEKVKKKIGSNAEMSCHWSTGHQSICRIVPALQ